MNSTLEVAIGVETCIAVMVGLLERTSALLGDIFLDSGRGNGEPYL